MVEPKKRYTLLIAEEDAVIRKETSSFLQLQGYDTLEAGSGSKALELLRSHKPDILITDLRMPGLDDSELLKITLQEFPLTPVIILSGMGTMQDAIDLLHLGAFDYISKPIQDMELILHSVKKGLEHLELKKRAQSHTDEMEALVQQRTMELLQQNKQLEKEMKKRQVQETLVLHAKQEWERTVDSMPEMIALVDNNHHIVRMNHSMQQKIGKPYEEIINKPCFHWLHGMQCPHGKCPHVKTLTDFREHTEEFYEPHLNCYVEVTTVPYKDPDGTLIGSVHIVRDISERKNQQKDYERLFESSRDAIIVTDESGFLDCNHAALKMFGYKDKEEFLTLCPADVSPEIQPDGTFSAEAAEKQIREAIEGRGVFFSWEHKRKDGSIFPAEILLSPFEREDKLVVQGVVRDVSDRLLADKDKEKLQSQLLHAQKLESVGQLAAGIAHEINTPAQFIGTNIDFLDEAVQDFIEFITQLKKIMATATAETEQAICHALEEADWEFLVTELPQAIAQSKDGVQRVTSIVRAMKEFSHPGSKEKVLYNLNNIIETTVTVARNEWKYVAEVKLDLDEDLPQLPLLVDEMGQVVLNMLVNGAHAIGDKLGENPQGDKGTITITTRNGKDHVLLTISDTGTGIPEESRTRIFDPFYTTKAVGKGTGQGLAIAHDVISKHEGAIRVESTAGKGTTFTIALPFDKIAKI